MKRFVLFAVGLCLVIGGLFISCAGDSGSGGTHTHSFSEKWKSNDTQHWKECSCGEKDEVADHIKDDGTVTKYATTTSSGEKTFKCTVCEKVMETKEIQKLDIDHVHKYEGAYLKDATGHWRICDCGEKETKTPHTGKWEIVTEATATETGKRVKECTVCGYEMDSEVIPIGVKYVNFDVSVSIAPNNDVEITKNDLEDTVELEVAGDYTECIWILDGELEYIGKKYVVQKSDLEPGIYPVTVVVDRKYSARCTITVVEKD